MTDTKNPSLRDPKVALSLAVVILVVGVVAFFGMRQEAPSEDGVPMPAPLSAENEAALRAFLVLKPELAGEVPEVVVIQNAAAEKKTQLFLENAEDGDVLFLFFTVEAAFLYRPSANQIIAEGPLHKGPPPAEAVPTR